ncbi:MAG: amidophosphoribosyltransferase [Clostridia bacterium]|nr:amidophosphoribosyltransferase [Clostridia bacterium]
MGVFGIVGNERTNVASSVYYGLYALQHRGQESCGISVNDDGVIHTYKDTGLVNDVFTSQRLESLGEGTMAIGHVRYGTMGTKGRINAEPLVVNHTKGHLAIATNGRLVNGSVLKQELEMKGMIFHTSSDAEIVSYVVIQERLNSVSIEQAVNKAMDKLKGGFCMLLMSPKKIIAVRDEQGFHPLCYGKRENGEYVIASESCALDSVGATFIRELEPGEILVFTKDSITSIKDHCKKKPESLCVFEYVYTARPDSIISNCSVHAARKKAGAFLSTVKPIEADVVVGVPDSGLDAALGYAEASGIPYGIGLLKNKYIGRTFIAPGQNVREDKVRIKLNPVKETVNGKRVILVDDSIVRGTTCARIVKLLRNAGAKEVHLRSSAPPFINPCYYGTDIDSKENLIACLHTEEEIAKIIGVDSLAYLRLEDVTKIGASGTCTGYCTACFDGNYPTETPKMIVNKYENKLSESENKR